MKNTIETTEVTQFQAKDGVVTTTHHVLINGVYQAHVTVDDLGNYVDGTFKFDTPACREIMNHINL